MAMFEFHVIIRHQNSIVLTPIPTRETSSVFRFLLPCWFIAFFCSAPTNGAAFPVVAHEGPDPVGHWEFHQRQLDGNRLKARVGADLLLTGPARWMEDSLGQSLVLTPRLQCVADSATAALLHLPKTAMTVAVWASVDQPQEWGGFVGTIQDDGGIERGWVLGYDNSVFTLVLSTTGADDGDGRQTVLRGTTRWEPGRLYHVAAVFDGKSAALYVNGQEEAFTAEQYGELLYPADAPFVVGGFRDSNEDYRLTGRIRDLRIYDLAAKPEWILQDFQHGMQLARLEARPAVASNGFAVDPYLQFATRDSITVMWRTAAKGTSVVHYGGTLECDQQVAADGNTEIHEVRIEKLEPETQYFYSVESTLEDGTVVESPVSTFSTAVNPETPFAFAVFGDTQKNPKVSGQLAEMAWAQRPSFLVHVGDLVDKGTIDTHWTEHFFPGMKPIAQRIPFYPVLGNHEENARNYFDYMALPNPEYHYEFTYGNTQFFMIDSNRNIAPGSEQYNWLKDQLSKSTAVWKIACHHHPPYSSDEDDYGNLWKTRTSSRGDMKARQLSALYDEFQVDIVWSGHIHSYERTWPVRENRAVEQQGTVYMITGGAGGNLETAGPFRPFFQNNVKRGHHYCMVMVNGRTMEIKAFDLEGRLFDTVTLKKAAGK
jgi:predicted phosphodiesterase